MPPYPANKYSNTTRKCHLPGASHTSRRRSSKIYFIYKLYTFTIGLFILDILLNKNCIDKSGLKIGLVTKRSCIVTTFPNNHLSTIAKMRPDVSKPDRSIATRRGIKRWAKFDTDFFRQPNVDLWQKTTCEMDDVDKRAGRKREGQLSECFIGTSCVSGVSTRTIPVVAHFQRPWGTNWAWSVLSTCQRESTLFGGGQLLVVNDPRHTDEVMQSLICLISTLA